MQGDFAHCNVDLCEPYGEQIHGSILRHGYPSQFDSHACVGHIVSSVCQMRMRLTMYITFSFIGISQTLPSTSYIKMIDLWMIFTMICPFSEILLVWLSDLFQRNVVSRQGWLKKNTEDAILILFLSFCLFNQKVISVNPRNYILEYWIVSVGPHTSAKKNMRTESRFAKLFPETNPIHVVRPNSASPISAVHDNQYQFNSGFGSCAIKFCLLRQCCSS